MKTELLTLFSRVIVPVSRFNVDVTRSPKADALNMEVAYFGYSFDADLLRHVRNLDSITFAVFRKDLIALLSEVTGDSHSHRTLFNKFPYETPDQHDYLVRRIIGHLETVIGVAVPNAKVLSCGHVIDPALFDLTDFGVCPICQHEVDELHSDDAEKFAFNNITPLKKLSVADVGFLREAAQTLLSRPDSLSGAEKSFLLAVIREHGVTVPKDVTFREQMPYAFLADRSFYDDRKMTATDVLRLAVFVSDPVNGDLSLKEPVRFKLSTSHKKAILRLLNRVVMDGSAAAMEDMLRNRERWLRLGEYLNPASKENLARYPFTAYLFGVLRNHPTAVQTFGRTVHRLMDDRDVRGLADVLVNRPGEFARRLDFMLRNTDDHKQVRDAFARVAPELTTKTLFGLSKYLWHRTGYRLSDKRAFFPKGNQNRAKIIEDGRKTISEGVLRAVQGTIVGELHRRLSGGESLGNVYVDPVLKGTILPFNRRGDSNTTSAVVKGAQYAMDDGPVLRFFIHWTGHIDVDLSAAAYNDEMRSLGSVGFYNTRDVWALHSGDVQNAPNGASEFIDIDIEKALATGHRYIAMQVISFRGDKFSSFPCYAGYMIRDELKSGKKYEPASVRLKFDLTSDTTSHLPLVFDLKERKVIFADMPSGSGRFGVTARQTSKIADTMTVMFDMVNRKPTFYEVLTTFGKARGTLVDDPTKADVVFNETTTADEVLALIGEAA